MIARGRDAIGGRSGSVEVVGDDNDPLAKTAASTNSTNLGENREGQQSQPAGREAKKEFLYKEERM